MKTYVEKQINGRWRMSGYRTEWSIRVGLNNWTFGIWWAPPRRRFCIGLDLGPLEVICVPRAYGGKRSRSSTS